MGIQTGLAGHPAIAALVRAGIGFGDAVQLRRISMQLLRWHEKECGIDNGAVERDADGRTWWRNAMTGHAYRTRDMETAALRRLAVVMGRYKEQGLAAYVQGDPRGCALYILRPGDVPEGEHAESYYSRGLPVYK